MRWHPTARFRCHDSFCAKSSCRQILHLFAPCPLTLLNPELEPVLNPEGAHIKAIRASAAAWLLVLAESTSEFPGFGFYRVSHPPPPLRPTSLSQREKS